MVLNVQGITKDFGSRRVLNDVSFTIDEGEILGFVGPNGAGKTTALKVILGLLRADGGNITINGYNTVSEHDKALSSVGAIIESPDLYGYMSGMDNLMQFARIHDISKQRVEEAARQVGLADRINDKVKRYSLGMRQRIGVAQAILHKPKLLLLDEPTNGLDPVGIKELRDTLRNLAEGGTAILVSSHLLSELELMCTSVCVIEQGNIIARRRLGDVTESSEEKSVYVFAASNPDNALLLAKQINPEAVTGSDGQIAVAVTQKEASAIAASIINSGYELYLMEKKHKTLEDAYLEFVSNSPKGGENK